MIQFNCLYCRKPLKVADDLEGKRIKCRHCDEDQEVPAPKEGPALKTVEKEPRFYWHIEIFTKILMVISFISLMGSVVHATLMVAVAKERVSNGHVIVALTSMGSIYSLCFSLLLIDIGRSLRIIRHNTGPKP